MNTLNKQADDNLNKLLYSLLIGSSGYAALRGIKDFFPKEKPKSELELTLPAARMPKLASDKKAEGVIDDFILPFFSVGGGTVGGFLGASKLYEYIKKKEMAGRMNKVQKDYTDALQQVHTKVAELKTPHIDKFINGLITKVGEDLQKKAQGDESPLDFLSAAGKGLWNSDVVNGWKSVLLLAGLGGMGATYGIAKANDKIKEKSKAQSTLPTEIKLNVV